MSTQPDSSASAPGGHSQQTSGRFKEVAGFEIMGKLGQGGMGAVYKARQKSLDRIVALKILPPSIAKDALFCERFQREARASAKLNHQHIVQGIDVGKDAASGLWYFAMEYVDGPTLKKVLEEQKLIPEERALAIIRQIALALEAVNAHGMVHRDIKPDNILLTQRGEAKLADLGLVKQLNEDASLTQSGQAVGTPYYMAPEQVRGAAAEIDIRTDIYALGGTLYHLVTGAPPYKGQTGAVIMAMHLTDPVPNARKANPAVSEACSRLIEKMMQKKREQRVQTPADLLKHIDKAIKGEVTAGPHAPVRHVTTGPRQPVGERRTEDEAEDAPKKNHFLHAAGGLAALVALALAFTAGSQPDVVAKPALKVAPARPNPEMKAAPKPLPAPEPPLAQVSAPVKTGPTPDELFKHAHDYELKNPDAYAEATQQYQLAAQAAKGAPAEADIQDKVDDAIAAIRNRQTAAADAFWKTTGDKAQAAVAENNYDLALALYQNLPPHFAPALKERADEKAQAAHKEAEAKVGAVVKRVEESVANVEPAQGLKTLEEIETLTYAPTAALLVSLKKRLTEDLANEGELKKKKEQMIADKSLVEVLVKFDQALLESKDLKAAQEVAAAAAKDETLASVEPITKALNDVAAAFNEKERFEQESLSGLKGRQVELELLTKTLKGKIARVQDGVISLEISFGGGVAVQPVKIADLTEVQRLKLLPPYSPQSDAQRIALAYMKLRNKDGQGALEQLVLSEGYALTPHCRKKIGEIQQDKDAALAEAAAPAAWGEIQLRATPLKLTDADSRALQEKIVKFETSFSKTQFAATVKDKLAAVKQKVLAASVGENLIGNGDFERGVDGWEALEGAKIDAFADKPHGGKGVAHMTIAPNSRGIVYFPLTLELEQSYKYMVWVRIIKPGNVTHASIQLFDGRARANEPQQELVTRGAEWVKTELTFTPQRAKVQMEVIMRNKGEAPVIIAIDDVEVTKVSATPALPPAPIPDALKLMGLVFWVSPSADPAGTTRDLVSNAKAADTGAVTPGTDSGFKTMGFASSYTSFPASPAVKAISTSGSAFVWIKLEKPVATPGGVLMRGDRTHTTFSMFVNAQNKFFMHFNYPENVWPGVEGKTAFYAKKPLPVNRWVMAGATWDGKTTTIYVNGEREGVYASAETPMKRDIPEQIVLGADLCATIEYFSGLMSGAAVFNRAISEFEVKTLFVFSGMVGK